MSNLSVNTITDASGGSTASINGLTPQASNMAATFNRIINGAMTIDQRNAGAAVTPTNIYTLDRWVAYQSVSSKYSVQQNAGAVTPPVGFSNYLGVTSLSAYSILAGSFYLLRQSVEGFITADLGWGTASAATVTLSFRVYSSLTGTFGGSISNSANNRSYPFSYSIPVANTWTSISITIAGDTTGTWVGATNGVGLQLNFSLGVGSTYSGTASSWAAAQYWSATGATSVVGTSGATFYITGVQLEAGSTASPFAHEFVGDTLRKCQRYYWKNKPASLYTYLATGISQSYFLSLHIQYPQVMRASPTFSYSGLSVEIGTLTTALATYAGDTSALYQVYTTSGAAVGESGVIRQGSAGVGYLDASAEL